MTGRIVPTVATANSVVSLGFTLNDFAPMPWSGRGGSRKFLPLFAEVRYTNEHDGQGWTWSVIVRGRRINQGGKLGAFDASAWFSSHPRAVHEVPVELRALAAEYMPGIPAVPASHGHAGAIGKDEARGRTGTWLGVPVQIRMVSYSGDVVMDYLDGTTAGVRRSLLEFVPDPAVE